MDPGNFEISLEKEFEREGSNATNKSKWKKLRGENILMKVIIKWSSDEHENFETILETICRDIWNK